MFLRKSLSNGKIYLSFVQGYRDENGNTVTGYFRSDGTQDKNYTGWAEKNGKKYRFEKGKQLTKKR